jgi:hypothetical protein
MTRLAGFIAPFHTKRPRLIEQPAKRASYRQAVGKFSGESCRDGDVCSVELGRGSLLVYADRKLLLDYRFGEIFPTLECSEPIAFDAALDN